MTRKNTIEDMRAIAKSRGGRCLSKKYVNSHTHLTWKCANGHQWQATATSIKNSGTWCPDCAGKRPSTIEEMRALAKTRGGRCLSKKISHSHTHLTWKCANDHQWQAMPTNIKSGKWCPHCAGVAKKSLDDMHKLAAERGGKCLSKKYINSNTPMKWQCQFGHTWKTKPSHIISSPTTETFFC